MAVQGDAIAGGEARAVRARIGILLVVIADGMFVASLLAGNLYLGALNVLGQFRPEAEHAPSFFVGLLLTVLVVVSALAYWWAARALAQSHDAGFRIGLRVAVGLVVIALIGQIWFVAGLGFPSPLHGYASMTILIGAYHGVHLMVTAVVGLLILGRLANQRLAGQPYVAEVAGYWWYYVAVVAVAIWALGLITQG